METIEYISLLPTEINEMIFSWLNSIIYLVSMALVNKYYHQVISNNKIYKEFKNFFEDQGTIMIFPYGECPNTDRIFMKACKYGSLMVLKYIYSKHKNIIDIHTQSEYPFQLSCREGHLEIMKFLLTIDGQINISADNYLAFKWSCMNGQLEIAKFLYSLDNPRRLAIDYALYSSENNNQFHVVEWLESLINL